MSAAAAWSHHPKWTSYLDLILKYAVQRFQDYQLVLMDSEKYYTHCHFSYGSSGPVDCFARSSTECRRVCHPFHCLLSILESASTSSLTHIRCWPSFAFGTGPGLCFGSSACCCCHQRIGHQECIAYLAHPPADRIICYPAATSSYSSSHSMA